MGLLHSRMTLRNLHLIDAIKREGSLLRAAQALNMSQSAVTKALQEVEATLGCSLFHRTNRGVVTTPSGDVLAAHARVMLTQLDHAEQELTNLRDGASGIVTVGTLLAASVSLLPKAIAHVRAGRPRLTVRTVEGPNASLMPLLRQGALDMVVGRLPVYRQRDGIAQERLLEDQAAIVMRRDHPLSRHPGPGPADLLRWDWILPPQDTTMRRQVDDLFREKGLQAPVAGVETLSVLITRDLLLHSDMLAIWPAEVAQAEDALGIVSVLPFDLSHTGRPVGISTREGGRLSPAAEALIDALRHVARA
ncbi:LysR substrate-binding domain-containing protein [Pararhodobacter sp.]|jgi:DNA-binding transcriptional LysR family regulator|uniref:LysR substrate-binding domain-containing protein n=1 Tax=Pararhodobacter sp. TaxID=2127056 RepID=UPI002FDD1E66